MNFKKYIIYLVIIFSALFSFKSHFLLAGELNVFLINAIRFTLLSSIIFIVFEKQILINFTRCWKTGVILGLLITVYFTLLTLSIERTGYFLPALILIATGIIFAKRNVLVYITLIAAMGLALAGIIMRGCFPAAVLMSIASAIPLYFTAVIAKRHREILTEFKKESFFTTTLIPAVVFIVIFLLTKPADAPRLDTFLQIHLLLLITAGTLMPVFLMFTDNNIFISRARLNIFIAISAVSLIGIVLFSPALLPVLSALTLLLILIARRSAVKGTGRIESIAIVALTAIIISLIIPVYRSIEDYSQIRKDRELISSKSLPAGFISIGNIYIRSRSGIPARIYEQQKDRIIAVPVR
ncbi:MAG: hypothetical protein R6U31_03335 [bacterium]